MTQLEAALIGIAEFLEGRGVSYAVAGGYANLTWGKPRLTQDIDLEVQIPDAELRSFIDAIGTDYTLMPEDPVAFAADMRVLPVRSRSGVRIDLILAGHPYEEAVIRRAVLVPVAGRDVRYCTAEDLILLKLVSERPRDREDIEGVFARQATALDAGYLRPRAAELAMALERPEIVEFIDASLARFGKA